MTTQNIPQTASTSSALDLNSLRLPANYGATLGVKKLLTNVPVRKPRKPQFFRTHPSADMAFGGMLLLQKEKDESYLVVQEVAEQINELVQAVDLFAAIDRQNNVFLIPVPRPGESGARNPWHESLFQAVELARESWIRIGANMQMGGYDVFEAQVSLSEPDWPEHDIYKLVEVAFRGKIIQSPDHPLVQGLLGRI